MDVLLLDINRQGTQISEQHTSIDVLATKVDAANGYLIRQGDASNTLTEMTKKNELCIKKLESMIESKIHLLVQEREDETRHRFFCGPGSNPQRPLFFEDALGVVLTLPIEWLESWKVSLTQTSKDEIDHQSTYDPLLATALKTGWVTRKSSAADTRWKTRSTGLKSRCYLGTKQ